MRKLYCFKLLCSSPSSQDIMKVLWNGYEKRIRKAIKADCTEFTKRREENCKEYWSRLGLSPIYPQIPESHKPKRLFGWWEKSFLQESGHHRLLKVVNKWRFDKICWSHLLSNIKINGVTRKICKTFYLFTFQLPFRQQ